MVLLKLPVYSSEGIQTFSIHNIVKVVTILNVSYLAFSAIIFLDSENKNIQKL